MSRKLFGTDGIRGIANDELDCSLAYRLGAALVTKLANSNDFTVLIGKDTRRSGDMLEAALCAGITSAGGNALSAGTVPTPAVAFLVNSGRADLGVMISASHNPAEYNGLKVFGANGVKLPDSLEEEIEELMESCEFRFAPADETGTVKADPELLSEYERHVASVLVPDGKKIKVLFDCSNGSASVCAPDIFDLDGVEADFVNCHPDGKNINLNCGSTHIEELSETVVKGGYDIAFAFDGDADRCLCLDEKGETVDGDKIICLLAAYFKRKGKLPKDTAVVTCLSNMGVEKALSEYGITAVRTAVGDRYVLEKMLSDGYCIGGEQSGHVILTEYATTGDGEVTAAAVLNVLTQSDKSASELFSLMEKFPQVTANVRADSEEKARYEKSEDVKKAIAYAEEKLSSNGRIIVRKSGTEPLIRIMLEGEDRTLIGELCSYVENAIEKAIRK